MLGELVDGIAPIEEHALVAVDESQVALAGRRGGKPRVVGEEVGIGIQLADVHDIGTLRAA